MSISHIADSAITSAGSTSCVISVPTNVAGDILYAHISFYQGGGTITPPSGWTLVDTYNTVGSGSGTAAYWHKSNGSEPSSYTWTFSGNTYNRGFMSSYRGVDGTNPINAHANNSGANSKPVSPSISPTVANCWYVTTFGTTNSTGLGAP